ncbi:MAG: transposase family protein [Dermatophilaceae bacterium]
MLSYRATLDVPHTTAARVSRWLQAHRNRVDARPWQRAGTCWTQAILVLRWFKDGTDVPLLARDAGLSQATGYRYLHEAIDVIADQLPDLKAVLAGGREAGWAFVALDGTLIESTRSSARSAAGHDLWYSGKHHTHGGNIQVVTDPTGFPVWVSPVEPGSVHDITAARTHALPALYAAAAAGLPTLADKGYTGAGIGIYVPVKGRHLHPDTRARNLLITALRAPSERANALLKTGWKALRRITVCPWRIGSVTAAALVLTTMQRGHW